MFSRIQVIIKGRPPVIDSNDDESELTAGGRKKDIKVNDQKENRELLDKSEEIRDDEEGQHCRYAHKLWLLADNKCPLELGFLPMETAHVAYADSDA
ncbi:hypothetical protein PQX77_021883 [Marasmius sp. AFHP31]|nr:hypothetical protein PQX77_021883 [Marasmius sp. AFHP31]